MSQGFPDAQMLGPRCPLTDLAMDPWLVVPFDWRRPDAENSRMLPLYRCPTSEYGQVFPVPGADDIASFYDLSSYYTHGSSAPSPARIKALERLRVHLAWRRDRGVDLGPSWLARHIGAPPASVCEIGCGDGATLRAMSEAGYETLGIEPDPRARHQAHETGLVVLDGTGETLPSDVTDRRFTLVILSHVLEHTRDPLLTLRNAARLLAPGGKMVIETPNSKCLGFAQAGMTWRFFDVPRHLHFFTERSLRLCAERVGLSVQAVEYTGYCRQFWNEWIDEERHICSLFEQAGSHTPLRPNTQARAFALLVRTMFAPQSLKYDSVRVVASRGAIVGTEDAYGTS